MTAGFFERAPTGLGHDRQLGAEALDVLGLAAEMPRRDQQREVDVLRAGVLDPIIDLRLHALPDRIAPRTDDHRAAHRAVLRKSALAMTS